MNINCKASDCCFNGGGSCFLEGIEISGDCKCGNNLELRAYELEAIKLRFAMERMESETEKKLSEAPKDKPKAKADGVTLEKLEDMYITKNMTLDGMSKELGVPRSSLHLKMQRLGIIAKKNKLRSDAEYEEEK